MEHKKHDPHCPKSLADPPLTIVDEETGDVWVIDQDKVVCRCQTRNQK